MSLFVTSLNSGSNGNCYYVGSLEEAVLIDGGISCRETLKRLKRLGLAPHQVKGIFVSHEHADHIHGIPSLVKKLNVPVFVTEATFRASGLDLPSELVRFIKAYEPIEIGALIVNAFPKHHDALDPHSFTVSHRGVTVGIFTDVGRLCDHVVSNFSKCHAAFLESNYDEYLLDIGPYPYFLKERIRNGKGHLSNSQAAALFKEHRNSNMSHLFLSHLSRENNTPQIVKQLFNKIAGQTEIIVTSRQKQIPLYQIREKPKAKLTMQMKVKARAEQPQLSLF